MDDWDDVLSEECTDAIKSMVGHPGFVLFLKRGNDIFAAPEESRIVFAKMKSDDEDDIWKKEASFMGMDLARALGGEKMQSLFGMGDMKGLEVMPDKDIICKLLGKIAKKADDPISGIKKVLASLGEE